MDKVKRYWLGTIKVLFDQMSEWCKSSDVSAIEAEIERLKCCGNCEQYIVCSYENRELDGSSICGKWKGC